MTTDDPPEVALREFGGRLLGGLSWTALSQVASQLVTFLAGVLLARLLLPSDFGILSMALAYVGFLWLVGQAGFNSAIVYLDDVDDADLCTMYWASLALDLLLFAVAVLLAPQIAGFFRTARIVPVVRVASLLLVVAALGGVQKALLEKRLDFRRLAKNQFIGSLAYAACALVLALLGMGVWALVVGKVIGDAVDAALAVVATRWLPKAAFSRASFRRLFEYGSRVWAANVLFYGQENIDNLVVGRMLGATPLGYYSFAFRIGNVPRYFFAGVIGRVMFPSFSSGKGQPALLKRAFLRINAYSILIAGGLCVGLALVAPEFVRVVYGPKWVPSIRVLGVLAVAAGIYCASQVTAPVLMAMGRPGLHARVVLGSSCVLLIGALIGARYYGILGVAFGVLASVTVAFGLAQYLASRMLAVHGGEYAREVAPPILAIAVMSFAVVAWRWFGEDILHMDKAVWLVLAIILGGAVLVASFVLADPGTRFADLLAAARGHAMWRRSRGGEGARSSRREPDEA